VIRLQRRRGVEEGAIGGDRQHKLERIRVFILSFGKEGVPNVSEEKSLKETRGGPLSRRL